MQKLASFRTLRDPEGRERERANQHDERQQGKQDVRIVHVALSRHRVREKLDWLGVAIVSVVTRNNRRPSAV